jgi:hypothetical protein
VNALNSNITQNDKNIGYNHVIGTASINNRSSITQCTHVDDIRFAYRILGSNSVLDLGVKFTASRDFSHPP